MFGKEVAGLITLMILLVLVGCDGQVRQQEGSGQPPESYESKLQTQSSGERLYQFIEQRLTGSDGVWTNFLDTDQSRQNATGHEVLSESAGLIMRYLARTGQQTAFDAEWVRARRVHDLSIGFSYRYSPKLEKRYSVNAAVDDLRIIRALHEAGIAFKDDRYIREAESYGKRFYKYNVKDGFVYDFYDEFYGVANDFITLCYIDLTSLQLLPVSSDPKKEIACKYAGNRTKRILDRCVSVLRNEVSL